MVYVIVSDILVLPLIWLPSWISSTQRCPMTSEVPLLLVDSENVGVAVGIFSLCALELKICMGGNFTPPRCRQTSQKKTVAGTRVNALNRSLKKRAAKCNLDS